MSLTMFSCEMCVNVHAAFEGRVKDQFELIANKEYSVETEEDLRKLAELTNAGKVAADAKPKQTKDIDLSGLSAEELLKPIGTEANPFNAKYDGDFYKIIGLKQTTDQITGGSLGWFGYIGSAGVVENLRLAAVDIQSDEDVEIATGAMAGKCHGCVSCCSADGTIAVKALTNDVTVGGLVRKLYGSMLACAAFGSVFGDGESCAAGDLAGWVYASSAAMHVCCSSASVEARSASLSNTGGAFAGDRGVPATSFGPFYATGHVVASCQLTGGANTYRIEPNDEKDKVSPPLVWRRKAATTRRLPSGQRCRSLI
ncbi:hypothetical protein FACS189481_0430 [Clostridia bacterium]|nr:hypothetical protein FACS189481_0430 [Clostridia bacterium]